MDKAERAFGWIVAVFKKHGIPFMLSGGLAARAYGSPRKLRDIDFDIPDEALAKIAADISKYIIFGPRRFMGRVFELMLIRLNYRGQKIDIGGGTYAKIYDRAKGIWFSDSTDFSNYESKIVFGIKVPVIKPEDLIAYKSKSPRNEDLVDIKAIKQFLSNREF